MAFEIERKQFYLAENHISSPPLIYISNKKYYKRKLSKIYRFDLRNWLSEINQKIVNLRITVIVVV